MRKYSIIVQDIRKDDEKTKAIIFNKILTGIYPETPQTTPDQIKDL